MGQDLYRVFLKVVDFIVTLLQTGWAWVARLFGQLFALFQSGSLTTQLIVIVLSIVLIALLLTVARPVFYRIEEIFAAIGRLVGLIIAYIPRIALIIWGIYAVLWLLNNVDRLSLNTAKVF